MHLSIKSPQSSYHNTESWTDDLPVCKNTGIGFSTNQVYREDGHPQEDHPYEDCSCHFEFNDSFCWYTVFDGHNGQKCASYCSQRMTAEIYFSQLSEKRSDEDIVDLLRQAFSTVEKGYLESLGDALAERASLQYDIPEGLSHYEAYQKVPYTIERIDRLNCELSSGAAAAVALVLNNKLYVGNVGSCRILLCQTDQNSVLKVVQLSVDHDLTNEDELLRLSHIGINTRHKILKLGNQENTRCFGNYTVKGGYKENDEIANALQEPVIADPDIHGGIELDDSCRFLLIMSSGLYKSIEEATGSEQVNKFIAQCVVEQFREQATLTGVAQAVVDKIVRLHHDWYMSNSANSTRKPKREDITLLLRSFNFPLPNAIKSPIANQRVTFNTNIVANSVSTVSTASSSSTLSKHTNDSTNTFDERTDTTSSSAKTDTDECLGPDQKIDGYVDFSEFYKNFNAAKREGRLPSGLEFS